VICRLLLQLPQHILPRPNTDDLLCQWVGDVLSSWHIEFMTNRDRASLSAWHFDYFYRRSRLHHHAPLHLVCRCVTHWVRDALSSWLNEFMTHSGHDSLRSWLVECVTQRLRDISITSTGATAYITTLHYWWRVVSVRDSLSSWLIEFMTRWDRDSLSAWYFDYCYRRYRLHRHVPLHLVCWCVTHWVRDSLSSWLIESVTRWVRDILITATGATDYITTLVCWWLIVSVRDTLIHDALSSWLVEFMTHWDRDSLSPWLFKFVICRFPLQVPQPVRPTLRYGWLIVSVCDSLSSWRVQCVIFRLWYLDCDI